MNKASLQKLNNSLKGFINTVTSEEILCYNEATGEMIVAGKPLAPEVTNQIISELLTLKHGLVWKFLMKDIVFVQNKVLAEQGTSVDDIIFNRAVRFNLKVLTETIDKWDKLIEARQKPEEKTE